jgi:hypothetical protein
MTPAAAVEVLLGVLFVHVVIVVQAEVAVTDLCVTISGIPNPLTVATQKILGT